MSSPSPEFTVRRDLPQTMRDGTVLRADVYLPKGKGPFPALLERTPYSKDNSPECQVGSPPFFASEPSSVKMMGTFTLAGFCAASIFRTVGTM